MEPSVYGTRSRTVRTDPPRWHRALGIGAEDWARSQGCMKIASDTWIDNEPSQRAHEALSFEVVDRCVHYRKALR